MLGASGVAAWTMACALASAALAGCIGDAADDAGGPDPAGAWVLPPDLTMADAEVVERSTTSVTFLWRGETGPGAEPASPPAATTFDVPAGVPLAIGAWVAFDAPLSDLDLALIDGSGAIVCRTTSGGPDNSGPQFEGCATPLAPVEAPATWTVEIIVYQAASPSVPFEVTLTLRIEPIVLEVLAPLAPGAPPGCDVRRPAIVHGGMAQDAPSAALPCLVRTQVGAWEPNVGITASGAVFASARPPGGGVGHGAARSFDEGATWELVAPDAAGQPAQPASVDPYLYVDPFTSRVFVDNMVSANCSLTSWSDDEGETWEHTVASCQDFDHQTIFAGPPVSSMTVGYPNVVYSCAINTVALADFGFSSTCSKSLDGGRTWALTGEPAYVPDPTMTGDDDLPGKCGGALGHGIVDAAGRILLPKGHCGQPHLAISEDEGLTWRRMQVSDLGMPITGPGGTYENEAGVGVDPAGNIYYTWVAGDRLPYLTVSTDDGATWSTPVMIGPPGLNQASFAELAVGGVGKIAVAYVGTVNSPGPPWDGDYSATDWSGYMTVSYDALSASPILHTATVNDPRDPLVRGTCGPIRCGNLGDFIDVRIGPDGTPWAPYVDTCTGCWLFEDAPLSDSRELVVGRLWGGPSLWDAADPNGPYPDGGEPAIVSGRASLFPDRPVRPS